MKRLISMGKGLILVTGAAAVLVLSWATHSRAVAQEPSQGEPAIGEVPAIQEHLDQEAINDGRVRFRKLFEAGERLFTARFTILDGQGRPAAVGGGMPVKRVPGVDRSKFSRTPAFLQSSGPTASSCAGCHYQPNIGGAGDFSVDVSIGANDLDPPVETFATEVGNERNALGMFGAGAIELLAREMTADLFRIRDEATRQAARLHQSVSAKLLTKGVEFGWITVGPTGQVNTERVQGVDGDLIIKPFFQKGVDISLRQFANDALNHHHGMQSVERFGQAQTGTDDFDEDGVRDEISVGDVTALTVFQASLGTPGRVFPSNREGREVVDQGEKIFRQVGCATCHRPFLVLNNPVFTEPGPFNPEGNLRQKDVPQPFSFDLTREGMRPRLQRDSDGKVLVRAFTDLKRHVIGDKDFPWFLNERVVQAGIPTDQFLTRKLWDVGNTGPYGHRGDLTTITEAILNHGGEGREARDAFAALSTPERNAVIEFLKSLQILPEGITEPNTTTDEILRLQRMRRGPIE